VTVPLVPKFSDTSLAGARLPVPEAVDWTTPLVTATVRVVLLAADPLDVRSARNAPTIERTAATLSP
jgi:hypothetical protein